MATAKEKLFDALSKIDSDGGPENDAACVQAFVDAIETYVDAHLDELLVIRSMKPLPEAP